MFVSDKSVPGTEAMHFALSLLAKGIVTLCDTLLRTTTPTDTSHCGPYNTVGTETCFRAVRLRSTVQGSTVTCPCTLGKEVSDCLTNEDSPSPQPLFAIETQKTKKWLCFDCQKERVEMREQRSLLPLRGVSRHEAMILL